MFTHPDLLTAAAQLRLERLHRQAERSRLVHSALTDTRAPKGAGRLNPRPSPA